MALIDRLNQEMTILLSDYKKNIEEFKKIEVNFGINKSKHDKILDIQIESIFKKQSQINIINRIFEIALIQFNRLRQTNNDYLLHDDVVEINKWIERTQTIDGLKSIYSAFIELKKYYPGDIKNNLYALIQKIINEGTYSQQVE